MLKSNDIWITICDNLFNTIFFSFLLDKNNREKKEERENKNLMWVCEKKLL